ncbi:MAG: glycosyltransferase [Vicinamibacterales bacterium]
MNTRAPSVSVIVCADRHTSWLERAVRSVLAQQWSDLEVLVVGDLPITVDDSRVRLVRAAADLAGAKRAAGLSAAGAQLIAYCDDEDVWTPDHLLILSLALSRDPQADLVYGDAEWVRNGKSKGIPYSYDFDVRTLARGNYIFASDVLHRAEPARAAGGFDPSSGEHEDWDLWLRMALRGGVRHVPLVIGRHEWHPESKRSRLSSADAEGVRARHAARAPGLTGREPFRPETWTPERRELIWCSLLEPHTGHGRVASELVKALAGEGVDIVLAPTVPRSVVPPQWERYCRFDHWGRLAFFYHTDFQPYRLHSERIVTYGMWESTALPALHLDQINAVASFHYVPSRQNLELYRDAGVRVPLRVLHHGVDPERFPILERPPRGRFTFGSFGDFSVRKGIDVLIRAFSDEFAPGEPVRLLLKDTFERIPYGIADPRIELVTGVLDQQALLGFLAQLDVFVLPSRGEGFGLCGLEAMATGLPLIATAWGGALEYLDPADSLPLRFTFVDPQGNRDHTTRERWVSYHGRWAEPDYEHLRELMRRLYEEPARAAQMGARAAARVRRDFTWPRVARQLREDLDGLAGLASS